MPADYASTARALSVSTSPEPLSPADEDSRPLWGHRSATSRRNSPRAEPNKVTSTSTGEATATFRDKVVQRGAKIWRRIGSTWRKMNWWQKSGAVAAVVASIALGLVFLYFTGQIFHWMAPVVEDWEKSWTAFLVLWLCVFFVSFPPLVGWSTFGMMAGFIFGVWKGWLLYASGTILGSTVSFVVSRTVLSRFVNRLMERDKRFAALALTLKYDGLKLLCMIRLCPLPYSICNGAVSTFPTVHPLMYGLATIIISPKLLVPAFIGSRLRLLSGDEKMSAGSKAINICSIVFTVGIGVFTGWYIYKRTLARAKELEAKEREEIRNSLDRDHSARRPHRAFSEDPNANIAATTLARDEEERAGFHDFDDDNVDIVIDDESDDGSSSPAKNAVSPYRDEFTDNDSDVFRDGDEPERETYRMHTHIRSNQG
ncbi:Golgi apparatus membrane protein tvp38 [Aspergillus cristatus]|uniref:Golgi apparatus membrane protein TVP38 n=1 Tax=Aspergillus cristatus TaxID=573508 RepID=A0A1E3BP68_ASPCR|nr:Golgi apparatus membrane protein tvp38 [Aspergillus cristatus]